MSQKLDGNFLSVLQTALNSFNESFGAPRVKRNGSLSQFPNMDETDVFFESESKSTVN